jgi:aliphatic nitrilase
MQPVISLVSAALAYSMKSFVINAVSTVSAEMVAAYGSLPGGEFLKSPFSKGRASVVSPTGQVLAEAQDDSEQLVYADIDTETVIIPKIVHDYAGHYNRPDLFAHLF